MTPKPPTKPTPIPASPPHTPAGSTNQHPRHTVMDYEHPPVIWKRCTTCRTVKHETQFHKNRSRRDGLQARCKPCNNEASRRWREANPDKKREYDRRWREANPDKKREKERRWHEANPDKKREKDRRWREANPDKTRARVQRRRARKAAAPTDNHTIEQLHQHWADNNIPQTCQLKGPNCTGSYDHTDHATPLSRGGHHTVHNLIPACATCNTSKGTRTLAEWQHWVTTQTKDT